MQDTTPTPKSTVNLEVETDLLDQAAASNLDLSALLETALRQALSDDQSTAGSPCETPEQWRQANADAIRSWNEDVERNGLWSDGLRTF